MGFVPTFSNTKIKYVGRPLAQITRANNILSDRYKANKASYENQIDMLDSLELETQNQSIAQDQADSTKQSFIDVISSNDFEHSGNVVSEQARAIKGNKALRGAIQSKTLHTAYSQDLDARVKNGALDANTANELRSEANSVNNQKITVDEDGNIANVFSAQLVVNDPKINDQLTTLTAKLKADSAPVVGPDGSMMRHVGNQWINIVTHETINNDRATAAITQMIMQDPKNQAWFAQKKRLADLDKYARSDNGTFARDAEGNLIEQPVDYRGKAESIGYDGEVIHGMLKAYNEAHDASDRLVLQDMSEEDRNDFYKHIYDSKYVSSQVTQMANAAVNAVDYDKYTVKTLQDQRWMFDYKLRKNAEYEKKLRLEAPVHTIGIIDGSSSLSKGIGDFVKNNAKLRINYENGLKQINSRMKTNGIKGTAFYDAEKGQIMVKNGNSIAPLTTKNGNGAILVEAQKAFIDSAVKYNANNKAFNNMLHQLPKEDKEALYKYAATEITERGLFDMMNDVPTKHLQTLEKEGLIDYTIRHGGIGSAPVLFPIGFGTISDDDATLIATPEKILQRIAELDPSSNIKINAYLEESLHDSNSQVSQRADKIIKNIYNNSNNNQEAARLITDKNDISFLEQDLRINNKGLYDVKGKLISEGQSSMYSAESLNGLGGVKNLKSSITFDGGKAKVIYTGTFPDSGDVKGDDFVLVNTNPPKGLLRKYTSDDEYANYIYYNEPLSNTFTNTDAFIHTDLDVGQPFKMRVERIGIDANDKYTTNFAKAMKPVFKVTELGGRRRSEYFTDLVAATHHVANYSKSVEQSRK